MCVFLFAKNKNEKSLPDAQNKKKIFPASLEIPTTLEMHSSYDIALLFLISIYQSYSIDKYNA